MDACARRHVHPRAALWTLWLRPDAALFDRTGHTTLGSHEIVGTCRRPRAADRGRTVHRGHRPHIDREPRPDIGRRGTAHDFVSTGAGAETVDAAGICSSAGTCSRACTCNHAIVRTTAIIAAIAERAIASPTTIAAFAEYDAICDGNDGHNGDDVTRSRDAAYDSGACRTTPEHNAEARVEAGAGRDERSCSAATGTGHAAARGERGLTTVVSGHRSGVAAGGTGAVVGGRTAARRAGVDLT